MNDILKRKYGDLFDIAQTTIADGAIFLVGQNANSLAKQVTLFHVVRAGYLLEAIYTLVVNGLATEAMVILRSLLNLYINIKWLSTTDVVKRFERYADFEVIFKKLAMQDVIDHGDIGDEIKNENLNVHDRDFESIKEKYCLRKKEDLFNWSGKSILKMASEQGVDLEKEYRIIYGRLSSIEHSGPESRRHYLDDSEKGITSFKTGPRDENVDLVLISALEYYFNVKAITHNIFDVERATFERNKEVFFNIRNRYWGD